MTAHDDQTPAELLHDLTDGQRVVMHVSQAEGRLEGRPLTVLEQDPVGRFRFLADRSKPWVTDGPALLSFTDDDDGRWVSATGMQRVVTDRAVIERLWNPLVHAWFEGPDDPNLVAVEVEVTEFSWWDSASNKLVRAAQLVRSAVGGPDHGDEGDHGHSRL
jgi:general stress protein 26